MITRFILIFLVSVLLFSCQETTPTEEAVSENQELYNPAAQGFNLVASDERAIAIADSVMWAQGGRKAWSQSRYFSWNFFGARSLWWDKKAGDVRIEVPGDSLTILVNIHSLEGQVYQGENAVTHPDTLRQFMEQGKSIWINDAYWLFMPFKLKDTGVTLNYLGKDTTQSGIDAYKLQLLFEEVGDTPQNKYEVLVGSEDYLVREWSFYGNREDTVPAFTTPWEDYKAYDGILLSGERGKRDITEIKVYDQLPTAVFNSLEVNKN
jgi:hypothetical protein